MIKYFDGFYQLDTKSTTMLLKEDNGYIVKVYYGEKLNCLEGINEYAPFAKFKIYSALDGLINFSSVISAFGEYNNKESFVMIENTDGSFVNRFLFTGHEIGKNLGDECCLPLAHGKKETLKLIFKDEYGVNLNLYYDVFEDSDVIATRSEIVNNSKKTIHVKRLMSLQLDEESIGFEVINFNGAWVQEREETRTFIKCGTYITDSKTGSSSNVHNPFFILKNKEDKNYAFNLIYSGNHKEIIQGMPIGETRILCGMNDFALNYKLNSKDKFCSPQAIFTFGKSRKKVEKEMRDFVLNHIIPSRFKNYERPVLLNNWEATYFNFNENKLKELVLKAKEAKIELFVLDDGWFGHRDGDNSSLGDWFDNEKKTGGLKKLSDFVREQGMKFGLWFEPEMISRDSELYKKHPEYVMSIPGIRPIERRNQLMLDLANREVCDYLVETISKVCDLCSPEYIKWDCNRMISDAYSSSCSTGEFFYNYVLGVYDITKRLTEQYPNILFEGCSGGGNRFDLGILRYMPQIWTSDDTDAIERIKIQEGTYSGYPQSTMGCHVSVCPNHQSGRIVPLFERFAVACIGDLGYELDITKLSNEEINEIRKQIEFYKSHRQLLQFGNLTVTKSQYDSDYVQWEVWNNELTEGIICCINLKIEINKIKKSIKIKEASSDYTYEVTEFGKEDKLILSGTLLNKLGLPIYLLERKSESNKYNSISANLFYLKKKEH